MTDNLNILLGMFTGTMLWILGGFILIQIGSVSPAQLTTGPFFQFSTIIDAYLIFGAILGVGDLLAIFSLLD